MIRACAQGAPGAAVASGPLRAAAGSAPVSGSPGIVNKAANHELEPMPTTQSGFSLLELMFVVGFTLTVGAIAVPHAAATLDDHRAAGATRYMAARFERLRADAVRRSTNVAMQFIQIEKGFAFTVYFDGNDDGVRTRDIEEGVDRPAGPSERLPDNFAGVDFGVRPGLPAVESGAAPPGADPIKLGASSLASFSSLGTASPGSVYIQGRTGSQYVIRVLGETGRTRVLKYDPRARLWKPL